MILSTREIMNEWHKWLPKFDPLNTYKTMTKNEKLHVWLLFLAELENKQNGEIWQNGNHMT